MTTSGGERPNGGDVRPMCDRYATDVRPNRRVSRLLTSGPPFFTPFLPDRQRQRKSLNKALTLDNPFDTISAKYTVYTRRVHLGFHWRSGAAPAYRQARSKRCRAAMPLHPQGKSLGRESQISSSFLGLVFIVARFGPGALTGRWLGSKRIGLAGGLGRSGSGWQVAWVRVAPGQKVAGLAGTRARS